MTSPSRPNVRDVMEGLEGGDCLRLEVMGMKSMILTYTGGGNGRTVGWWASFHHRVTVTCVW